MDQVRELVRNPHGREGPVGVLADAHHRQVAPGNLTDGNPDTYWASDDGVTKAILTIGFPSAVTFKNILLREPIRFGQRISQFQVQVLENQEWKTIFKGTTIGHKRLIALEPVTTAAIRILIMDSISPPAVSEISVY